MRLNNEDNSSDERKCDWTDILINVVSVMTCAILIIFVCYSCAKQAAYSCTDEDIKINTYVTDMYRIKSDDGVVKYYMKVDSGIYGLFDIEISKSDFMTYKERDIVPIIIERNYAHIDLAPEEDLQKDYK